MASFSQALFLGVIEYLNDPLGVLMRARASAEHFIASYCHPREKSNLRKRRKHGIVNDYSRSEIADLLKIRNCRSSDASGLGVRESRLFLRSKHVIEVIYRADAGIPDKKAVFAVDLKRVTQKRAPFGLIATAI